MVKLLNRELKKINKNNIQTDIQLITINKI